MKERPILFSSKMVSAIIRGKKSQTRRVVATDLRPQSKDTYMRGFPENPQNVRMCGPYAKCDAPSGSHSASYRVPCPYGLPGDRLWVREAFRVSRDGKGFALWYKADGAEARYWANYDKGKVADIDAFALKHANSGKTISSIHMPRWASRLTLDICTVRVERLQDITPQDARAEGFPFHPLDASPLAAMDPVDWYSALWDSINADRGYSWESNPFVWAITFKPIAGEAATP